MKFSTKAEQREAVEYLLSKLGVAPSKQGFLYLSVFITLAWQERNTTLYPFQEYGNQIAREANIFPGRIYTNMKYAVEEVWFLGNFKLLDAIFGYSLMTMVTEAPSPNKFIRGIVTALIALEENHANLSAFIESIERNDCRLLMDFSGYQHAAKKD